MNKSLTISWAIFVTLSLIAIGFMVGTLVYSDMKTFDHMQCQYPYRSTNPPNGCDNSDPCDPLDAIKGGSGECDDAELQ